VFLFVPFVFILSLTEMLLSIFIFLGVVATALSRPHGATRRTPFGVFPTSCVHKEKSGSHFFTRNGTVFVSHPSELKARPVPKCVGRKKAGEAKKQFPSSYDGVRTREVCGVFFEKKTTVACVHELQDHVPDV
jgi:hypothetical protein